MKWKWSGNPLSATGSYNQPGGRFNIGDVEPVSFPMFPALYVGSDKSTAMQESLAQAPEGEHPLSPLDLALSSDASILVASVSGKLDSAFDLRDPNKLAAFCDLIKNFKLSPALAKEAARLKVPAPSIVRTPSDLLSTLLQKNWRHYPQRYSVPSNSQIFGQIVEAAGIEGIIYPSKFTERECLAIFPRNFAHGTSFVALDDEPPHPNVPRKIDFSNWQQFVLTPEAVGSSLH